jgi:hypothetical protein
LERRQSRDDANARKRKFVLSLFRQAKCRAHFECSAASEGEALYIVFLKRD